MCVERYVLTEIKIIIIIIFIILHVWNEVTSVEFDV